MNVKEKHQESISAPAKRKGHTEQGRKSICHRTERTKWTEEGLQLSCDSESVLTSAVT